MNRLNGAMQQAQSVLPDKPRCATRKWQTSERTLNLLKERAEKWSTLSDEDKKQYKSELVDLHEMTIGIM